MTRPAHAPSRNPAASGLRPLCLLAGLALLTACSAWETTEPPAEALGPPQALQPKVQPPPPALPAGAADNSVALPGGAAGRDVGPAQIVLGSGQFVNPAALPSGGEGVIPAGDDVTLDFTNVAIRDVLKSVLGDLLGLSYTVDENVQGTITLQTGSPIPRSALIDVLTDTLQLQGVGLAERNGLSLAVPLENATRQAPLGGSSGFVTRVRTVQYVGAADLAQALEPVIPATTTLKPDPGRNLLIVSGPAGDVARVLENAAVFDADFMKGMSFALLPLRYGEARGIAQDVNRMLAASSPSAAQVVRALPIDRTNAILVTSKQPKYIRQVRDWVARLDRGDGESEPRMYVYRVQNGRATHLAQVMRRALGLQGSDSGAADAGKTGPGGAGGAAARSLGDGFGSDGSGSGGFGGDGLGAAIQGGASPVASDSPAASDRPADPLGSVDVLADMGADADPRNARKPVLRISADSSNNALVIVAPPQEYAQIEAALQKLDVTPLQVLIEATVAEVTLNDQFALGLQYAFKSGNFAAVFSPDVAPTSLGGATPGAGGGTIPAFPGLGFATGANLLYSTASSTVLLQALSKLTNVRVLSSPNLMVLNNGTARLQIGDQVPTATQSSTSNVSPGAPTVNSIEYRDTGVILDVVPRVNASGLVVMDIFEEVSQPTGTTTSALQSPTIQQRRVTSSIAVHDGETIALAGLIQDSRENSNSGIPWLKDVPVLGYLFGTRSEAGRRTELLVLITPHVIRSRGESEAVTRELQDKLRATIPVLQRSR
ncbi:MAG: type II secretion system secretin GspD [Sneathiellaceae bacterium]